MTATTSGKFGIHVGLVVLPVTLWGLGSVSNRVSPLKNKMAEEVRFELTDGFPHRPISSRVP